jgi:uncharacterized integral membrane protein
MMNKKLIVALVIVVLTALVLLFNMIGGEKTTVNLIITKLSSVYKSIAFLGFTLAGVLIGVLLK